MSKEQYRNLRLSLLSLVCLTGLVPALAVWLVNLEIAARVFIPRFSFLERLLPDNLFDCLSFFAADLSSISTLVVVLLLLFPLIMSWRVMRLAGRNPAALGRLIYDPYPPHFPFFMVMLGLAGTLYGLLIGLSVSGVSELGVSLSSPETIQQTLDQLLGGTATALLSSLFGLLGAFLAARPFTWLFHWAACLPAEDESVRLTDTLRHVTGELRELGEAGRLFAERLQQTSVEDIPGTLAGIRAELTGLRGETNNLRQRVDALVELQTSANSLQAQVLESQVKDREQRDAGARQAAAARDRMTEILVALRGDREDDRRALRAAFTRFLEVETAENDKSYTGVKKSE